MGVQLSLLGGELAAPTPPSVVPQRADVERSAIISPCERYRYSLTRRWAPLGPYVLWVMLNPSTADAVDEDRTLDRCIHFARSWSAASLIVVNLAAWRSSHPDELLDETRNTIGPDNDRHITEAIERVMAVPGGRLVAAWGQSMRFDEWAPKGFRNRDQHVLQKLRRFGDVWCLGTTKTGAPKHPLARGKHRIPDDQQPVLFAAKIEDDPVE